MTAARSVGLARAVAEALLRCAAGSPSASAIRRSSSLRSSSASSAVHSAASTAVPCASTIASSEYAWPTRQR